MFVLKGDSQIAISFGSVHSRRPSDDSGRDSWRVFVRVFLPLNAQANSSVEERFSHTTPGLPPFRIFSKVIILHCEGN